MAQSQSKSRVLSSQDGPKTPNNPPVFNGWMDGNGDFKQPISPFLKMLVKNHPIDSQP